MNNRYITWPRSSFHMTLLLVGIAVVGIGTSMLLTDDPRWLQWHLSRLGEGGHISSGIFNLTLCLVALLFVVIGERLYAKIGTRAWLLRLLFFVVAVGWVGLASFPYDRFPMIHNSFGYGGMSVLALIMIALPRICPGFSTKVYLYGVSVAIITLLLMVGYHLSRQITLLVVELVGEAFLAGWLLLLTYDARRFARDSPK